MAFLPILRWNTVEVEVINHYIPKSLFIHLGPLLLTWFNFNPSMDK